MSLADVHIFLCETNKACDIFAPVVSCVYAYFQLQAKIPLQINMTLKNFAGKA